MPVLRYLVCADFIRCILELARSSRSCETRSLSALCRTCGTCGNCRFLGEPVGVAVAERDWNLGPYVCVGIMASYSEQYVRPSGGDKLRWSPILLGDFERDLEWCILGESDGAAEWDRWPTIPVWNR